VRTHLHRGRKRLSEMVKLRLGGKVRAEDVVKADAVGTVKKINIGSKARSVVTAMAGGL